ncbi:hypothetical protein AX769_09945 [Frondihabitans sp. PAMC 28766]|nr:hypothetical protein AX769_09945 [Frondihabitans sp. PAMC 28766]
MGIAMSSAPAVAADLPACPTYSSPSPGGAPRGTDANVTVFAGGDYVAGAGAAESEGVLAVGGTATFDKDPGGTFNVGVVGVGSQVTPPAGSDMLLAAGAVTVGGRTVVDVGHGIGGNVVGGSTIDSVDRFETSGGSVTPNSADALGPFAGFSSVVTDKSRDYAGLAPTGTTSVLYGVRTFQGDGTSARQVFDVSGAALGSTSQSMAFRFRGIPTGASVVINVTGATADVYPAGFFEGDSNTQIDFGDPRFVEVASHTLWNFASADSVTLGTGDQLLGSVLVPAKGSVTTVTASTNGRLLVGGDLHFAGDGNEAHSYPFPDPEFECKPTITPIPETGALAVQKVVDDPAGFVDSGRLYTGTYECQSPTGSAIPGGSWGVRPESAPTVIADNLPVGSTCSLTETPPPTPDPSDPSYVWQPAVISPSPVMIAAGSASVVTVTNTVTRQLGTFALVKRLTEASGVVDPARVFSGTYGCQFDGRDVTPADDTWSTTAGASPIALGPVPIGSECRVQERLGGPPQSGAPGVGWGPTLISPSRVVVRQGGADLVTVSNSTAALTGSFSLSKSVSGDPAGFDPASQFAFDYVCTPPGGSAGQTVAVALRDGGQTVVSGVPVGSSCTVTEGKSPGTTDPSYTWLAPSVSVTDPRAIVSGRSATFIVPPTTSPLVQVAYTDELVRRTTSFAVQKLLLGPRLVVDPDRRYSGVWACTFVGREIDGGRWSVTANSGPQTVAVSLPVGTSCIANEDLQVTPPATGSVAYQWSPTGLEAGSTVLAGTAPGVISITNIVQAVSASASIVKVAQDPDGVLSGDETYSGEITCVPGDGAAPLSRSWSIRAGETPQPLLGGIPDGSVCTVTEDPPPAADGTEWAPSVTSPSSFTAYADFPVTVTVTNTALATTPPEEGGPGDGGPGDGGPGDGGDSGVVDPGSGGSAATTAELAYTGDTFPVMALVAAVASIAIGGALMVGRRRPQRRHRAG